MINKLELESKMLLISQTVCRGSNVTESQIHVKASENFLKKIIHIIRHKASLFLIEFYIVTGFV